MLFGSDEYATITVIKRDGEGIGPLTHPASDPAQRDTVLHPIRKEGLVHIRKSGNGKQFFCFKPPIREVFLFLILYIMHLEVRPRIENIRAAEPTYGSGSRPILWGDPGLYPGADTISSRLSRGLSGLDLLGSAGILTTEEGEAAVKSHFRNVIGTQDRVDFVTTPTWNTSPFIFNRVQGDPRLPKGKTAESVTKRGVQIARETLEEEGSEATLLLSLRPTGNSLDGSGTLPPGKIKRMFSDQATWLLEAAGSRSSVLLLETEPTERGARAFAEVAEEFNHPYIVTFRPADDGYMPDGSSYNRVADAVAGENFVGGGFNCQTAGAIEAAMDLASKQGAESLTFMAAPNGAEGFNESIDELTESAKSQIRTDNITGLTRLRERFGTFIIAGCCNSTTEDLATWQGELQEGGAQSPTRLRSLRQSAYFI